MIFTILRFHDPRWHSVFSLSDSGDAHFYQRCPLCGAQYDRVDGLLPLLDLGTQETPRRPALQ